MKLTEEAEQEMAELGFDLLIIPKDSNGFVVSYYKAEIVLKLNEEHSDLIRNKIRKEK